MEINWFVFTAQIVNFLILVAVLQRFLYRPIIQAMDRREQTIRDRLAAAEQAQQAAQEEAESYRQRQQDFTDRQAALLAQARTEIEQVRQTALQAARAEVDATQVRWQTAISQQKDSFLRELRHRAAQQIQNTISQVLADLANVQLEQQIIAEFLTRLDKLEDAEHQLLQELAANPGEKISIHSAFALSPAARQAILENLQQHLAVPIDLQFEIAPDLICGIELRTLGSKMSWSVENYLDELAEHLATIFDEETGDAG